MSTDSRAMSGDEMVALTRRHTLFEWSAQAAVDPIPVARAAGIYFWTPEGKRFIDFNSQLMCVNAGHGEPRIVEAIRRQVETLAYVNPFMATEPRARLGARLAAITPGDIDTFFFTNGGAEANENAIKLARFVTGRHKILARYRSYHGATAGSITLTGDPRRWAAEPGIPGVVHVLDPYHGIARGWEPAASSLAMLEEIVQLEGPHTIAAFILEPVTGTNGVLVPPDGYLQGVRELCDRHGILLIADEVMSGFGRTGEWFAVNHWGVVPDLLTMAKGLTSAYVPLGAVGMRHGIAEHFKDKVFYGGLTYNSHPLACAAALALLEETIQLEGPQTIAAFILETVTGTNGILVPPDGYLEGVRALCTKYGILMICDEVMAGFGRTGAWFAVDHWNVVPDLITMAKGLTSSYVPLGAVGMRRAIADHFRDRVFYGGLTYNSHPVGCAAALATIKVYEEDKLVERARASGKVMKQLMTKLAEKHPSVGAARSIGLFGLIELIRDRRTREPLAPFNGTSEEMAALGKFVRQEGLYTMVRWNTFFTNPPLTITEAELREAFAIIDRGLEITDRAVRD